MKARCSKTYWKDGCIVNNTFTIKDATIDLFDNAIKDAELYASTREGKVKIVRNVNSLYINYLDVPGSNLIDTLYQIRP